MRENGSFLEPIRSLMCFESQGWLFWVQGSNSDIQTISKEKSIFQTPLVLLFTRFRHGLLESRGFFFVCFFVLNMSGVDKRTGYNKEIEDLPLPLLMSYGKSKTKVKQRIILCVFFSFFWKGNSKEEYQRRIYMLLRSPGTWLWVYVCVCVVA